MAKLPFLERIQQDKPLLADGAMGTMLHQRGASIEACFDNLNVVQSDIVLGIHRDFVAAGAQLLESNTFSANRYKLQEYGLQDDVAAINGAGVELAKQAAQDSHNPDDIYVAGSLGPLGVRLKPYGRVKAEDAREAFAEQITALAQAGADLLVMETFADVPELIEAIAAARAVAPHLPIIAQMSFVGDERSGEERTLAGYQPARVALDLHKAGADVIGVNCSNGPAQLARVLQVMHEAVPDAVYSIMPNAGFPQAHGGRLMYPASVEYFADYAPTFKALGANIIGGCCGTTPAHIAAMRQALDDPNHALPDIQVLHSHSHEHDDDAARPTDLARKLAQGEFVISVEMSPPRSFSLSKLLDDARLLRDAGADVINVADSPTAKMRMSPWAVCHILQTKLGMETVLHFPTRGRNLLRVQGDLLAAHALDLRNLFVCMGDPTRIGDYPDAMDNYDVVPSGLIRLINERMNHGVDQAGNSIGTPTTFNIGCALNMCADDLDHEIDVLRKKLEAGANFALSQAVFDPAAIERFHRRYEEIEGKPLKLPVLMGVIPLVTLRHALYLNNEVPGIVIPDSILKRMEDAGDGEAGKQEGTRIASELLIQFKPLVQGAYIIPPFNQYGIAAQVIDAVVSVPSVG